MSKARVVFCLATTPALVGFVIWLGIGLLNDDMRMNTLLFLGTISIGIAVCWFVGLGTLSLFLLGRRRDMVERFDCLALCVTLSFTLPLISASVAVVGVRPDETIDGLMTLLGGAGVGLLFAPFGLFGGWLLWRIAIRPAAIPLEEIAQVF